MPTHITINESQFRDLRICLKKALNLDEVAMEGGEVTTLKHLGEYSPIATGSLFDARYRATGEAEHESDVSYAQSAVWALRGKEIEVLLADGVRCRVLVESAAVNEIVRGEAQDGDGDYSVRLVFTLRGRLMIL